MLYITIKYVKYNGYCFNVIRKLHTTKKKSNRMGIRIGDNEDNIKCKSNKSIYIFILLNNRR